VPPRARYMFFAKLLFDPIGLAPTVSSGKTRIFITLRVYFEPLKTHTHTRPVVRTNREAARPAELLWQTVFARRRKLFGKTRGGRAELLAWIRFRGFSFFARHHGACNAIYVTIFRPNFRASFLPERTKSPL